MFILFVLPAFFKVLLHERQWKYTITYDTSEIDKLSLKRFYIAKIVPTITLTVLITAKSADFPETLLQEKMLMGNFS